MMKTTRKENETDEEYYSRVIKAHGEPEWNWLYEAYKVKIAEHLNAHNAFYKLFQDEMDGVQKKLEKELDSAVHREAKATGRGVGLPTNKRRRVKFSYHKINKEVPRHT